MSIKNAPPKLMDVARLTGHTVGTVSKALNGKSGLSDKTRERILRAASDLGYVGNSLAGALRSGTTRTAAILIGDIGNPLFSLYARELIAQLSRNGYSAMLLNTDETPDGESRAVVTALSKRVDGVLICPAQQTRENLEFLRKNDVPYVLVGRHFEGGDEDSVDFDDRAGGRMQAEHLLGLGHRRILLLGGPEYVSSARERRQGYLDAFARAGLSPAPELMREIGIASDALPGEIEALWKGGLRFSAVCAFSDYVAWQVLCALNALGLRVPGDVSVVGYDNLQSHLNVPIPLTTIHTDKRELAVRAVDCLLKRIQGAGGAVETARLPVRLVIRGTTAPAE